MSKACEVTSEDFIIFGMIHAFRIIDEVKKSKTCNNLNDVNFEFLIEVQKRNLSNPDLIYLYQKIIDDTDKMDSFR